MDFKEDVYCPLCGKKMSKYLLSNANVNVDICLDGCGGLYFDNRELKKISDNEIDSNKLVEILSGKDFEKVEIKNQLKCPTCKGFMVKHYTTPSKRNEVDECYSCGGIFVKSDIFLKMLEEMKLPPEKQEKLKDYLTTYMTPEVASELDSEDPKNSSRLKEILYNFTNL